MDLHHEIYSIRVIKSVVLGKQALMLKLEQKKKKKQKNKKISALRSSLY